MKLKNVLGIATLALLMIVGVSFDAMGQGRGRRNSQWDRKCAKFVNCHDARDGRVDGRGPSRRLNRTSIFRRTRPNRDFDVISRRRHHDRDFDRSRSWRRRR